MNGDKPHQNANDYNQKSHQNAQRFTVNYLHKPTGSSMSKDTPKPAFLKKHWASLTVIVGACCLTAGFVYFMLTKIQFSAPPQATPLPTKKVTPQKFYSKVSHLEVPTEADTTKAVTAIMIENSPDARPQSGLKDAEIVFESVAEGGITRFLTIFQVNKPQLIGPVRSVREYYIDWLTPFEPSVAHVGGSATALKTIRNGQYRDIDQMFNGNFYWRSTDRYAPHNVYTSFEKLDALNKQRGYLTSNVESFARQIPNPKKDQPAIATNINFTISSALYNSGYTYNPTTNLYARHQAGKPHLDRERGQITANAVIAIETNMSRVPQDGYRERVDSIGEGKAYVFQNGQVTEGTWKKPSTQKQIRFYDANHQEIAINAGQVWITAIPKSSGKVTWN